MFFLLILLVYFIFIFLPFAALKDPEDCLQKSEFVTLVTCMAAVVIILLVLCAVLVFLVRRKRMEKEEFNSDIPQKQIGIVDFKIPRVTN